ncbi:MAG: PEP/pyruvate-binding domain-containing protein [Myxococcota bacterium]
MRRPTLYFLNALPEEAAAQVGGKAAHLARLTAAGVPVPPGFALTADAFRSFIRHHRLELDLPASPAVAASTASEGTAAAATSPAAAAAAAAPSAAAVIPRLTPEAELALERIRAQIFTLPMLPEMGAALAEASRHLLSALAPDAAVAVRSSGLSEDSAHASFAGQYESVLNVRGEEAIQQAVRTVWASYFLPRAYRYRLMQGAQPSRGPAKEPVLDLGVLVQVMVVPRASGVLFTLNPVTGARHELLLEAGWGLGEAYVSGQLTPDAFYIARPRARFMPAGVSITNRRIAHKAERLVSKPRMGSEQNSPQSSTPENLMLEPVPPEEQDQPSLTDGQVEQLARLGLRIERLFKTPQDIEWALDARGQLFILQARPITALLERAYARRASVLWTRRFSGERWTEPATPLGWALIEPVLAHFIAFEEVSRKHLQGSPPVKLVEGHPYFNITIFRHLVWKVAGFAPPQFILEFFPREEQEEMLAAPSILPNLGLVTDVLWDFLKQRRWRRYHYNFLTNHRAWEAFLPGFLRAIDALPEHTHSAQEARALLSVGQDWVKAYVRIHLLSLLFANLYYQVLAGIVHRLGLEDSEQLLSDLVAWPGENKTVETNRALAALADVVRHTPTLRTHFQLGGAGLGLEQLQSVPGAEAFRVGLQVFLDRYGHRAGASWEVFSPRWVDAPERVLHMVGSLLRSATEGKPEQLETARMLARGQAEQRLFQQVAYRPLKRMLLRHVLESTRAYVVLRENQRFYFDLLLLKIKRTAEGLGHHLAAEGWLQQGQDVMYLTLEDIDEVLAGRPTRAEILQKVEQRRMAQQHAQVANPPAFLEGEAERVVPVLEGGKTLSGLGISPGRITGTARVLHHWQELDKLKPGDILVTRATDPGWTFLFMTAGGLITELGSLLSHGAVVAREYKLPAVVNVTDATRLVRDGQQITLDGFRGLIYLH